MKFIFSVLVTLIAFSAYGQSNPPEYNRIKDSLQTIEKNAKNDTSFIYAKYEWVLYSNNFHPEENLSKIEEIIQLCDKGLKKKKFRKNEKNFFIKFKAWAYNEMGFYYELKGNSKKTLECFENALNLRKKLKDPILVGMSFSNIGLIYHSTGDFPKAISYFLKAKREYDKENDTAYLLSADFNIACVYMDMQKYTDAKKYFKKYIDFWTIKEDDNQLVDAYVNMGLVEELSGNFDIAEDFYMKALKIREKQGFVAELASLYNNLGVLENSRNNQNKSIEYYKLALAIYEKLGNYDGILGCFINLGNASMGKRDFKNAYNYFETALGVMKKSNSTDYKKNLFQCLVELDSVSGDYKKAFQHYRLFVKFRDSLFNEETVRKITEHEMQYGFDKKSLEDSIANAKQKQIDDAKLAQSEAENRYRKNTQYFLFGGLALVFVFAGFMYNRFRVTQKQKTIIELKEKETNLQKEIIEEKQKEIIDSINYAKRLQQAILAKPEEIKSVFPNSFLLYKPKDIVAGDFYFFEVTESHIFYAAADCTGHGVPGAMMSIVCANALKRCVKEFELTDPGSILDKTRDLVLETFEKSKGDVKDGMDISLLVIKRNSNLMYWAGANNPLWIIENGNWNEIKGDKQHIGKTDNPHPFTTHFLNSMNPGNSLFLFTDGYSDQFGGQKGKKFKYSNLKKLLSENIAFEPESICLTLESKFNDWKGDLEQTDDVCVIGIKF